jgi:hypothetical protein
MVFNVLQLPKQSVPTTTNVVGSNPSHGDVYSILSKVDIIKGQYYQRSILSKVNIIRSRYYQMSILSKVDIIKGVVVLNSPKLPKG